MHLRNRVRPIKFAQAREQRNNPTKSERVLWGYLRCKQLGLRFHRQNIIRGYIVDFYCPGAKLVIELDGPTHDPVYDDRRDNQLANLGIKTLRFPYSLVFINPWIILETISSEIVLRADLSKEKTAEKRKVQNKKMRPGCQA
jgi:very-short-patch-repair endonuclease